jgi:hypothetical protein
LPVVAVAVVAIWVAEVAQAVFAMVQGMWTLWQVIPSRLVLGVVAVLYRERLELMATILFLTLLHL